MGNVTASIALEHLKSEENLLAAVHDGTYRPPDVHWMTCADGMGRVTFIGRVMDDDGNLDIIYVFPVTVFDVEGLKDATIDASLKYMGPAD
jgi:hypothetical protein